MLFLKGNQSPLGGFEGLNTKTTFLRRLPRVKMRTQAASQKLFFSCCYSSFFLGSNFRRWTLGFKKANISDPVKYPHSFTVILNDSSERGWPPVLLGQPSALSTDRVLEGIGKQEEPPAQGKATGPLFFCVWVYVCSCICVCLNAHPCVRVWATTASLTLNTGSVYLAAVSKTLKHFVLVSAFMPLSFSHTRWKSVFGQLGYNYSGGECSL